MSRLPIITDLHFGSRADSQVLYEHQARFFEQVFWPAIDAEGDVQDVICLGDVTDRRKFIRFDTLSVAKSLFFTPARDRGIRVHWLLGNHDLPYKHSLSLSSHEAFKEYDNVHVYRTATEQTFQDVPVLFMPWLCDENMQDSLQTLDGFTGSVVMGHFEFGGFDMYRGVPSAHGLNPDLFRSFALVLSGHYHHKSSRSPIHYLGSPYDMIWSDADDPRGFHWWTPQTHDLEFVRNPHQLFYKFVYDDRDRPTTYVRDLIVSMTHAPVAQRIVKVRVVHKAQPLWYETFVDAAMKLGAHDLQFLDETITGLTDDDASEDHDASMDTLTTIHWYVNSVPWANSQVQQDVTNLMTSLYQDAVELSKSVSRV